MTPTNHTQTQAILKGTHHNPHQHLGPHPDTHNNTPGITIRVHNPNAKSITAIETNNNNQTHTLKQSHPNDIFQTFLPNRQLPIQYTLHTQNKNGAQHKNQDPYNYPPTLTNQDLQHFNQDTDPQIHKKLGAHHKNHNKTQGIAFTVWAPNARSISILTNLNQWTPHTHPMRSLGKSGVWELFIPNLQPNQPYKYQILTQNNQSLLKSDPYAQQFEPPPHNASLTPTNNPYQWNDHQWSQQRPKSNWKTKPISIYEIHLGSWKRIPEQNNRPLTYREITPQLIQYLKKMHYTHLELMPIAEHPFNDSWGYQITGYYAPTHRYGPPNDLRYLIDQLHKNNLGIILDWVPAHFPKDQFALAQFDGTHLYEHADPRQGEHQDWGTLIFNYGRPEIRSFLIANALHWCQQYHIDGLRIDAVASLLYLDYSRPPGQWIPNRHGGHENLEAIHFLQQTNDTLHQHQPGTITIAEESTAWNGVTKPTHQNGLGFDLKWNMGWMHDTLNYFKKDPIHRKWHHNNLTLPHQYQHTENYTLTLSHDEVVHGKQSLLNKMNAPSIPQKSQQLRALYAWMWAWPGKKTIFMGSDFGQSNEWNHTQSLDWHLLQYPDHHGIQSLISNLNHLYQQHPNLSQTDHAHNPLQWINPDDNQNSVISFTRPAKNPQHTLLTIANLTPTPHPHYRLGVPHPGAWIETLNTNSTKYGGSHTQPPQQPQTQPIPWNQQPQSITLNLPGNTTLYLQPKPHPNQPTQPN